MKHKHSVLRIGAVVSSLALIGTYVGCRALSGSTRTSGDDPKNVRHEDVFGGTKSAAVFTPPPEPPPPSDERRRQMMGGSKSVAISHPDDFKPAQSPGRSPADAPPK